MTLQNFWAQYVPGDEYFKQNECFLKLILLIRIICQ